MQPEVLEARKRVALKRYLAKHHIAFDVNESTEALAKRAKMHGYLVKHQPEDIHLLMETLTSEQIENIAKGDHYVNQLVCMKRMFGVNSGIGCVEQTPEDATRTIQCRTIADLVKIGWVSSQWLFLDAYLPNLKVISQDIPYHSQERR
jgi:hypothetical protein